MALLGRIQRKIQFSLEGREKAEKRADGRMEREKSREKRGRAREDHESVWGVFSFLI